MSAWVKSRRGSAVDVECRVPMKVLDAVAGKPAFKAAFKAMAVVFDLDGTLTSVASPWRMIHEAFGVWERARRYHDRFFAGEIDYSTWCAKDAGLWEGRRLDEVWALIDGIEPRPEALNVLARAGACRVEGGGRLPLMILSSGFVRTAERVVAMAGLEPDRVEVIANDIREEGGKLVGVSNVSLRDPEHGKRAHLARFVESCGARPERVVAFDDRDEARLYSSLGAFIRVREAVDLYRLLDYLP